MVGSGNSCTCTCWSPPVAVSTRAFIRLVASERGAYDLLARLKRNGDSGAPWRRRLQEEAVIDPSLRGVSDPADNVGQAVPIPGNGQSSNRLLGLQQLGVAASRRQTHHLGPLGATAPFH